jgi:hypothetical protein
MSRTIYTCKLPYVGSVVYLLAAQLLKKTPTAFTRGTISDHKGFSETNINYFKRIAFHYTSCLEIHVGLGMDFLIRLITITNQCCTGSIGSISNYFIFLDNKGEVLVTIPLRMIWSVIIKGDFQTLSKDSVFHVAYYNILKKNVKKI